MGDGAVPSLIRRWSGDHLCTPPAPPATRTPSVLLRLWPKGEGAGACLPELSSCSPFCISRWIKAPHLFLSRAGMSAWGSAILFATPSLRLGKNFDLRKWGRPFPEELLLLVPVFQGTTAHVTPHVTARGAASAAGSGEPWLPFLWPHLWAQRRPSPGQRVGPGGAGSCRPWTRGAAQPAGAGFVCARC